MIIKTQRLFSLHEIGVCPEAAAFTKGCYLHKGDVAWTEEAGAFGCFSFGLEAPTRRVKFIAIAKKRFLPLE